MILYFSGTGNSAYAAEALADRLQDQAVSANTYIKEDRKGVFHSDSPWVFVFPVYIDSIASIFADFLRRASFEGSRKAYFVATCASDMGITPDIAADICKLQGLEFMGAVQITMPQDYILMFPMTEPEEIANRLLNVSEAADRISRAIRAGRHLYVKMHSRPYVKVMDSVTTVFNRDFINTAKFHVTDKCISCGMCERVCPLNNVRLVNGRPTWGSNCVECTACINHCPKSAIEFGKGTEGKKRYVCAKYRPAKAVSTVAHFPANASASNNDMKPEEKPMKVLLAGAYGHLGSDILRALCAGDYEIIATGRAPREIEGVDPSRYTFRQLDVTDPASVKGCCEGVDTVITTIGLTGASTRYTNFDIDYNGNLNLLKEAQRAGVRHFAYISVINADKGEGIPMVHCKYMLEQELKKSGMTYVIYRPTGYFYDIAHVFWPMIKTKSVQLLKCTKEPVANVIDTRDFAAFILNTMNETNKTYNVGGTETYTYRQIAEMFYNADGVTNGPVKVVPAFMMDVLSRLPKIKKEGKADVIRFSKFTLTNDCYGDTEVPGYSFKEYIAGKSYAARIEKEKGL